MEEYIKYLIWLGAILAIIGAVAPAYAQTIALVEFVIGVIVGILLWKIDKNVFEKAVFYAVAPAAMQFFQVATIGAITAIFMAYMEFMAWVYVPAAVIYYLGKIVKEGF